MIRFKAKIKEINGSIVTIETFDYKEAVSIDTHSKLYRKYTGPYTEKPIEIPKELIGKKIRCIL